MVNFTEPTRRRGFLGTVAAGAVSMIGLASLAKGAPRRFSPYASPQPGTADASFEAWVAKMKGKHKQVFDAPTTNSGFPFAWARVFLMTNKQMGVPETDVTAVIVLRHEAIPAALRNDLCPRYSLDERSSVPDAPTTPPALRNPFSQPKPGEQPLPDMSIEDL